MKNLNYKDTFILLFVSIVLFFSTINTIPVLDRDEARYAQSSRQMIETSDYFNIKFQEDYRSKKPVGIYWLQTALVQLISNTKIDSLHRNIIIKDNIWKYRLTSSLAGILSILIIYFFAKNIYGRKIAFYSALILACSLLFTVEAHIAKTDSVLLTLSILVMVLLSGYYSGKYEKKIDYRFFLLWIGIGFSILIKGPVLPFIVIITLLSLTLVNRDYDWLKKTYPIFGLLVIILINAPWLFFMSDAQMNSLIAEGIKHDFLGKIIQSQENHGAFFGAHFISLWVLFFPMSFFLFPLFLNIKENYKNKKYTFLLAWLIPSFVILEFIPTKLPHYTLPLYPALSILMAHLIYEKKYDYFFKYFSLIGYFFYFIAGLAIVSLLSIGIIKFGHFNNYFLLLSIVLPILILSGIVLLYKKGILYTFYYKLTIACIFFFLIFYAYLPNMKKLWVSEKIANTIELDNQKYKSGRVAALGYNEPSLVFEIGTNIKIIKSIDFLSNNIKKFDYLVIEKKYYNKVMEIVVHNDIKYQLLNKFQGFNSAKNKNVLIFIFKLS